MQYFARLHRSIKYFLFPHLHFSAFFPYALLISFPAPCCRPPLNTATAPSVPGTLLATQRVPSATSTCGGCSISGRWTLNLPSGKCFTCLRRHRESTATSTTGNRPRTSGPGMILLFWSCSASGYVVNLHSLFTFLSFLLYICDSVNKSSVFIFMSTPLFWRFHLFPTCLIEYKVFNAVESWWELLRFEWYLGHYQFC